MTDPTDSGQVQPTDLLRYEQQTRALYASLVAYQKAGGRDHPADHGLGIFHQVQRIDGVPHLEGVLVHVEGGTIVSGPVPMDIEPDPVDLQAYIRWLLLGVSHDQQSDSAPAPAAEPAREINAPAAAEPAAADPSPDDEPDTELHERVLDLLDQLHNHNPAALKTVATTYRERFEIGRTPLVKSITTVARAEWLTGAVLEHLPPEDSLNG